jgi:retron-type reverse transcriptase
MFTIKSILHNGSIGVRLNDENGDFFLTSRGVREGDPISPILLNFMVDLFTNMLVRKLLIIGSLLD